MKQEQYCKCFFFLVFVAIIRMDNDIHLNNLRSPKLGSFHFRLKPTAMKQIATLFSYVIAVIITLQLNCSFDLQLNTRPN